MAHAAKHFPENEKENEKESNTPTADPAPPLHGFPLSAGTSHIAIDDLDDALYTGKQDFHPSALDPFYEGISTAVEACAPYFQASAETVRGLGRKAKNLRDEKPLQFLAVIAASAFALGMVLRFWRSRS
jgi:hypothetical protein